MRSQRLGQQLRAIVLAIPFAGAMACGGSVGVLDAGCTNPGGCGPCPTVTEVIPLSDAGLIDGGCQPECARFIVLQSCSFTVVDGGGAVSCTGSTACHTGRRPPGLLTSVEPAVPHTLGAMFSEVARLEAASVPAFRLLARELSENGAPRGLIQAAQAAAGDERRHARAVSALARRFRGTPARPTITALPRRRSLEAIAIENAVEGCVRETYGALVAAWQARSAGDPVVARTMGPIAGDEARHAELAWRVEAWSSSRLSGASRQRVKAARTQSFAQLRLEAVRPLPAAHVTIAGLPSPETAARLLDRLEAGILRGRGATRFA